MENTQSWLNTEKSNIYKMENNTNPTIKLFCLFHLIITSLILAGCNFSNQNKSSKSENDSIKAEHSDATERDHFPFTLKNKEKELKFEKAPERVAAMLQQDAEIFVDLGLTDKLVGYSLVTMETPERYKNALKDVPVMADQIPSKEDVFKIDPDFIISTEQDFIGNRLGTREELERMNIHSYVTKSPSPATIENQVYKQIKELARIFDVEEKGAFVIDSLQLEIDKITEQIPDNKEILDVVYLSGGEGSSPQATGGDSLDSYLMKLAGGKNIFEALNGYRVQVSWEDIVARNPDIIVIGYCCGSDYEPQIKRIKNKSSLKEISAVKNDRFVSVQVEETTGSMRIPDGLRKLVKGFHPEAFED